MGGGETPTIINTIEYINILSTGNAVDFGDLSVTRSIGSACSSSTRGVLGGGVTPSKSDVIDYIIIATTGDAVDFGNLNTARKGLSACSNGHGGLG